MSAAVLLGALLVGAPSAFALPVDCELVARPVETGESGVLIPVHSDQSVSDDGSVVLGSDLHQDLWVVDLESGDAWQHPELQVLTPPSLSGDGSHVLVEAPSSTGDHPQLYLTEVGGDGPPLALAPNGDDILDGAIDGSLDGDGSAVVFTSEGDLTGQNAGHHPNVFLWFEGTLVQVTANSGPGAADIHYFEPSISRDGSRIVVMEQDWDPPGGAAWDDRIRVFEVDAGGAVTETSASAIEDAGDPVLDADGDRVLYTTTSGLLRVAEVGGEVLWQGDPGAGAAIDLSADGGTVLWLGPAGLLRSRVEPERDLPVLLPSGGFAIAQSIDGDGSRVVGSDDEGFVAECGPFNDVAPSHAFVGDITWMDEQGISTGYASGDFQPSAPVSRQAMAAFLYRFAGEPATTPPGSPSFEDVGLDHAFFDEVEWLVDEGIAVGYQDDTFRPAAPVSRQAMSAFLYRVADAGPTTPPEVATFDDVSPSHPFFEEVEWMAAEEISTGYEDHTFRPAAPVSRQAMSAFLHRLSDLLAP